MIDLAHPGVAFSAAKQAAKNGVSEKDLEQYKPFMLPSDWEIVLREVARYQQAKR